ncbi:MAG: elongation factor P [Kiritimatiellae bacterium]|nr:elongation factor P [Kiritimatiellia bacterium]
MYSASDLRKGLKIEMDGDPYEVVDFQFVKPGKGQAMYKCRIKNMITGAALDKTYRAVDKIGEPNLEERDLVYSYQEGHHYIFMDQHTFEQVHIEPAALGNQRYFLKENIEVAVLFHNGRAIGITLPYFIEMKVVQTEPGARGDTATNVLKPAKTDSGYEVQVPLFISEGDVIRIDTRTGEYSGRVN